MERRATELDEAKPTELDEAKPTVSEENTEKAQITIEDFGKLSLRVGKVISAEKMPKTNKLLLLKVDMGKEERTIVSGIAKWYTPEQMLGKQVVIIANLAPAVFRGVKSEGMILCAEDASGNVVVVSPEKSVTPGSEVC